ncbi:MAG: NAD(P)H-dependent oxidoreductase [Bacteroidota bacterium]
MITVLACTNREQSDSIIFANQFKVFFDEKNIDSQVLNLMDLPTDFIHPGMYSQKGQSPEIQNIQKLFILPVDKFFFVVPEYNGGMPGILKLFIDACSVYELDKSFKGKKAAIAGIAAGRAGNLRGMEHLTGILNFLGVTVMPNRLPISSIMRLYDENKTISDVDTLKVMRTMANEFIQF